MQILLFPLAYGRFRDSSYALQQHSTSESWRPQTYAGTLCKRKCGFCLIYYLNCKYLHACHRGTTLADRFPAVFDSVQFTISSTGSISVCVFRVEDASDCSIDNILGNTFISTGVNQAFLGAFVQQSIAISLFSLTVCIYSCTVEDDQLHTPSIPLLFESIHCCLMKISFLSGHQCNTWSNLSHIVTSAIQPSGMDFQ